MFSGTISQGCTYVTCLATRYVTVSSGTLIRVERLSLKEKVETGCMYLHYKFTH